MKLIVFHCKMDNNGRGSWIVAKEEIDGTFLGIAECPDQHTATVIKEALEVRVNRKSVVRDCLFCQNIGSDTCTCPVTKEEP